MHEKLLEISRLLEDEEEEAIKVLQEIETVSVRDPEFHLGLVEMCEQAGVIERIPSELHLALRDSPKDINILKRLAAFYLDSGDPEKAEKYFRKAIEIEPREDLYRELWHILEEKGEFETLEVLSIKLKELFPGSDLAELEVSPEKIEEMSEHISVSDDEVEILPDTGLVKFLSLFSGREGVYARQWVSPTGESGYTPIKEPFNYKVARNHMLGNYTVGIYQLRVDNTVNFIAFDIDITKKYLSRIMAEKKLWKGAIKNAHKVACSIIDVLSSYDIPVYLESSGYKGRHCWVFLEKPVSAKIAKAFAGAVVREIGDFPQGIDVEIFPKQEYVRSGGLGNLIKIPLGIHRKTGRKSVFINPLSGKSYEDQLGYVETFLKCSKEKIVDFTRKYSSVPIVHKKEKEEDITEEEPRPVIKAIDVEYDIEGDKEFKYIILKCEVIRFLYDKIREYSELTNDEIIILTHTIGYILNGPEAVNYLLKLCPGVSDRYYLKSSLRGHPISCPKIRKRIPDVTSKLSCNCKFENYPDMYPTPVLYIQDLKNPSLGAFSTIDSIQFQILVQEYLKNRKQLQRLHDIYKNQKRQLDRFFEEADIFSIQTSFGTLKRVSDGDKFNYILEI